ncbi:hypothetical protein [Ralstonia sp. GX3-BWBA]|uniref:hypothetical protein n=1 Tax=Ralstonia sp. GX3-BWBA TaxID=2219865 RepID=UPI0013A6E915|nr:hypothetical protein [Ralstonia sp. GX3-BWBA]
MSHLRLVAGTDVTGPAPKKTRAPARKQAAKPEVDSKTLERQARAIVCGLKAGLDGKSVEALIAEQCRLLDGDYESVGQAIRRSGEIRHALKSIGIHAQVTFPEQELDVAAYGIVIDPKTLLKVYPVLKPYVQVLEGLTL